MTQPTKVLPITPERVLMGKTRWEAGQHRIMLQTHVPVRGVETEFGFIGAIASGIGSTISAIAAPVGQYFASKEYAKGAKATAAAQIEATRIQTAGITQVARTMAPILALGTLGAVFVAIMYAKKKPASAKGV